MQFDSISAFFDMGGYAFFVWLSYGISTVLFVGLVYFSQLSHNQAKQKILLRIKREQKLRLAAEKNDQQPKQKNSQQPSTSPTQNDQESN
jgi:heme exporter protein D